MWGFPDAPDMTMLDRFKADYRGKRYSFGYPACPRLEDQAPLFKVLKPEEIGVQLSERVHDGPRGERLRPRVPPPGREVLLRAGPRRRSRRRRGMRSLATGTPALPPPLILSVGPKLASASRAGVEGPTGTRLLPAGSVGKSVAFGPSTPGRLQLQLSVPALRMSGGQR